MASKSGSLRRYLVTRLLLVVPMVFILLTLVFVLMRVEMCIRDRSSAVGLMAVTDINRFSRRFS